MRKLLPRSVASVPAAVASSLALAAFFQSAPSRASTCSSKVASPCIASDTFWPHAGPARFTTVGGDETVAPGALSLGLVTDYQSRPLVLNVPTAGPTTAQSIAVDDQLGATLLFAFGVTRALQLDFAVPVTVWQSGAGLSALTGGKALPAVAMRDARFGFALRLLSNGGPYALTLRQEMAVPTGDEAQLNGERGPVWVPAVVGGYRRGRWSAAVEVGMRVRPVTEIVGARFGTQLHAAVGLGMDLLPHAHLLGVSVEARALPMLVPQDQLVAGSGAAQAVPGGPALAPAEWTVALRSAPFAGSALAFELGGGGPIPFRGEADATAPRVRVILGLRYAPAPSQEAP